MSVNEIDLKTELRVVALNQKAKTESQQENSRSIKSMESSISKLANTVTEFVVESRHIKKDVSELNQVIHGKGEILDRIGLVETANAVKVGRKELLWRWLVPVGTLASGIILTLIAVFLNKGP